LRRRRNDDRRQEAADYGHGCESGHAGAVEHHVWQTFRRCSVRSDEAEVVERARLIELYSDIKDRNET
jgi:hypothetical protein